MTRSGVPLDSLNQDLRYKSQNLFLFFLFFSGIYIKVTFIRKL